jgi:hypothetical protein
MDQMETPSEDPPQGVSPSLPQEDLTTPRKNPTRTEEEATSESQSTSGESVSGDSVSGTGTPELEPEPDREKRRKSSPASTKTHPGTPYAQNRSGDTPLSGAAPSQGPSPVREEGETPYGKAQPVPILSTASRESTPSEEAAKDPLGVGSTFIQVKISSSKTKEFVINGKGKKM